jgi:hypothetical protein
MTLSRKFIGRSSVALGACLLFVAALASPATAAPNVAEPVADVDVHEQARKLADLSHAYDSNQAGGGNTVNGGFATSPVASFRWSYRGVTIVVPAGCFLNMSVRGSGLRVTGSTTAVECYGLAAVVPGMFCNWSGVYRFKDVNGRQYAQETTSVRSGCGQAVFNIPSVKKHTLRPGSMCVDFRNNGEVRGRTCMAIYR